MTHLINRIVVGYMFSLTDLEEVLAAVSHENRRWSYAMAHDYARMNRTYVIKR